MAGRKRVRVLAAVLAFVVVAIVYTRRARLESYPDYVAEKVIGGGSVLRGDRKAVDGAQHSTASLTAKLQVVVPTTTSSTAAHVAGPLRPDATAETTTKGAVEATSTSKSAAATTIPAVGPVAADDGLPRYQEEGAKEASTRPTTASIIHWASQPQQFPVSTTIQIPTGSPKAIPRIQYTGKDAGTADEDRLAIIKGATEHAWKGYREVAFGADELKPISGGQKNPFNGWGATLIDSLDTLWIMGMKDEFDEAVEAVREVDFTTSARNDIPLFETTIRYLGGLVAAYDISGKQNKYNILLEKAVELAEVLYAAFDTPNRMPQTYFKWKPAYASQPHRAASRVVLAELGSLSLEFTRLAQLTGEPKYYDAIARITNSFEEWQNSTRLPGMWPIHVDTSGCEKPAQMAKSASAVNQRPVPGNEDQMMEAIGPVRQGARNRGSPAASVQKPEAPLRQGEPYAKASSQVTNALGSSKVKRELDDLAMDGSAGKADTNSTRAKEAPRSRPDMETMIGQDVCIDAGLRSSARSGAEQYTLGGMSDSTYEYLPKEFLLLGGNVDQYRTMYEASVDAATSRLLFRPMTIDNLDILISGKLSISINATDGEKSYQLVPDSEHLTCFAGGMYAMGGKIFNRPEDVEIGRKLTDGCVWGYNSTATGIMPEIFQAVACDGWKDEECQWDLEKYYKLLDPYEESRTMAMMPSVAAHAGAARTRAAGIGMQTPAVQRKLEEMGVNAAAGNEEPTKIQDKQLKVARDVDEFGDSKINLKEQTSTTAAARQTAPAAQQAAAAQPVGPASRKPVYPSHHQETIYSPPPPLSHEDYVKRKIENERLPPGFVSIGSRGYILRPEAIESVFYMYRITGEQYWRDVGWRMFESVETHSRTLYGHAAVDDVTAEASDLRDSMESFWTAETLKYFYLLFDDKDRWSLDDWVLNTEAHFFRRPT